MGSAHTQEVVHACAPGRSSLRLIRRALCALRVRHLRRGICPCARPLRRGVPASRFAVPVRRTPPKPAPGPGHSPRLIRSACVRRCAAPWRSLPPQSLPVPSALLRASVGRPCAASARVGSLRGSPGPPLPVPFGASGPAGSAPREARGPLARVLSALPPGAFLCAACTRAALFVLSRCAWLCSGS